MHSAPCTVHRAQCTVTYPYSKSQQDAPFTSNLFQCLTSTCFEQASCSSAGGITLYRVIRNDCQGFNNLLPRSPDATPCDFFLWGYVKDQVYVPPFTASIPELKVRIRTAIETITADMLQTVWKELDYRVDVCRLTKGIQTERL